MAEDRQLVDEVRQLAKYALARVERGNATPPRLLDINDAARYLAMSDKGVRELIVKGELPYIQKIPGRSPYLLDIRDLDAWVMKNKVWAGDQTPRDNLTLALAKRLSR